ncbi:flagellar biosynthesis protein FlhB [Scleromatobacter humisilvae]|uniref:Flagellar biosynthetic protein FlhB n=1 Tax=Scleromatobacter humisilvae TaxID=2897159 RepID=A0A9X1YFB6_9BURK|nr:flagellar biosynthesis protein FlhB [Scleromatobacter humisilvae]MCK9684627.1 flagellar biosynthesis protein FlhB [Scleromatobacter humisilvae]
MADNADRNLPASAKKIRKARQEGNVPRSRDLGHFVAMGLAAALLFTAMPSLASYSQRLLADGLTFDHSVIASPQIAGEHAVGLFTRGFMVVLIVGGLFMVAGVVANIAFGGWNLTMKAVAPNFGKLNPIAGFGRLFNFHQLVTVLKASLLAIAVGFAGTMYLKAHFAELGGVLQADLPDGLATVGRTLAAGFLSMLLVLAAWAGFDVFWQKKTYMDKLKMSREEQKQEHKESEGNVEVKAKMKQKMREMAKRRMMKAVPAADIVVMNPTHYAVALKYDQEAAGAPRVVAKGTDRLAMRIRDLARDAGVPVLEAPPLARALYTHVEIDGEVPTVLFAAVAQVLAWVYQLRATPNLNLRAPNVNVPPELDPLTGGPKPKRRRPPRAASATAE